MGVHWTQQSRGGVCSTPRNSIFDHSVGANVITLSRNHAFSVVVKREKLRQPNMTIPAASAPVGGIAA